MMSCQFLELFRRFSDIETTCFPGLQPVSFHSTRRNILNFSSFLLMSLSTLAVSLHILSFHLIFYLADLFNKLLIINKRKRFFHVLNSFWFFKIFMMDLLWLFSRTSFLNLFFSKFQSFQIMQLFAFASNRDACWKAWRVYL